MNILGGGVLYILVNRTLGMQIMGIHIILYATTIKKNEVGVKMHLICIYTKQH